MEADACGVPDRIQDGGRGSVVGQLADAFCSVAAVFEGNLFKENMNRRDVFGGGDDVVGHLVVGHVSILQHHLFVQSIADALRSHGVEVWFDQNELRGGDAWDQKIRRQIADCTLFIPIISRNTQERGKGYFRLEWKLAVEQTHLMAEGMAYLAPVAVDETPESGAIVPPEFMRRISLGPHMFSLSLLRPTAPSLSVTWPELS